MDIIYCLKCNSEIPDKSKFCLECGYKFEIEVNQETDDKKLQDEIYISNTQVNDYKFYLNKAKEIRNSISPSFSELLKCISDAINLAPKNLKDNVKEEAGLLLNEIAMNKHNFNFNDFQKDITLDTYNLFIKRTNGVISLLKEAKRYKPNDDKILKSLSIVNQSYIKSYKTKDNKYLQLPDKNEIKMASKSRNYESECKKAMGKLGLDTSRLLPDLLKYLSLSPNEEIQFAYGCIGKRTITHEGNLIITNERVIIMLRKLGGAHIETFTYEQISNVSEKVGFLSGELEISTTGDKKISIAISKNYAIAGAKLIRDNISMLKQQRNVRKPAKSNDLVGQLERLQKLRESGAISESEFRELKKDLLN